MTDASPAFAEPLPDRTGRTGLDRAAWGRSPASQNAPGDLAGHLPAPTPPASPLSAEGRAARRLERIIAMNDVQTTGTESQTVAEARDKIEADARDEVMDKRTEIAPEALEALQATKDALAALERDDAEDALGQLAAAVGKLEVVLARAPDLALAVVDASVRTTETLADVATLKIVRDEAEDAMRDGHTQVARHLLRDFASETVVSITSLPLATYPEAMREAARLLDNGNSKHARRLLRLTLASLVTQEVVLPHPLLVASHLLHEAQTLAEKADQTPEESDRLAACLAEARRRLERAEALGYGSKADFDGFYDEIAAIGQQTAGGGSGVGFFDRIRAMLDNLVARLRHRSSERAEAGEQARREMESVR